MLTFKELRQASGMSVKQFSDYFELPYSTLQNWEDGKRHCPDELLDLMAYRLKNENYKDLLENKGRKASHQLYVIRRRNEDMKVLIEKIDSLNKERMEALKKRSYFKQKERADLLWK